MAATPILCQGTTLSFNSVVVNGVVGITGIGSGSATEHDVTTLASTAKEFKPGLRDFGSISVDLVRNQDDLGQLELFNGLANQSTFTVVITLPTSTANVATCQGFVKNITTDVAADGVVMGKAEIRITGAVAWS